MPHPTVSIITRTKDRPLLLPRAIQSVLAQTREDWELIIVNDGGDPEPVDRLVETHGSAAGGRIRIVHRDSSRGMEAASNAGIAQASGRYVVIHDDDDSWNPGFLQACLAHLEGADPRVGGVVTHSTRVDETITDGVVEIQSRAPYNAGLIWISLVEMARGNTFPPISFVFRRSVYDDVGGFREDLPVLGDWEFNLRVLARHTLEVIPEELAHYHLRQQQLSGTYGNTVIAGLSVHARYHRRIQDELLRADLESGRFGMGFLVNARSLMNADREEHNATKRAVQEAQARLLTDMTVSLRRAGVRDIIVYGAGDAGRRFAEIALAMGIRIARFADGNEQLWGGTIGKTGITSLALAAQLGLNRYVVASFACGDEIVEIIRRFHREHRLPEPEIHLPLGEARAGTETRTMERTT